MICNVSTCFPTYPDRFQFLFSLFIKYLFKKRVRRSWRQESGRHWCWVARPPNNTTCFNMNYIICCVFVYTIQYLSVFGNIPEKVGKGSWNEADGSSHCSDSIQNLVPNTGWKGLRSIWNNWIYSIHLPFGYNSMISLEQDYI